MPTPANVIRAFFLKGVPARAAVPELKALTADDRDQLVTGIADGTFTY